MGTDVLEWWVHFFERVCSTLPDLVRSQSTPFFLWLCAPTVWGNRWLEVCCHQVFELRYVIVHILFRFIEVICDYHLPTKSESIHASHASKMEVTRWTCCNNTFGSIDPIHIRSHSHHFDFLCAWIKILWHLRHQKDRAWAHLPIGHTAWSKPNLFRWYRVGASSFVCLTEIRLQLYILRIVNAYDKQAGSPVAVNHAVATKLEQPCQCLEYDWRDHAVDESVWTGEDTG